MDSSRLSLRLPKRCPACQETRSIGLETTVKATTVALTWCCRACNHVWPVTTGPDDIERRSRSERRAHPRTDRRKS